MAEISQVDRASAKGGEEQTAPLPMALLLLLAATHAAAFVDRNLSSAMAPALKTGMGLRDAQLGALQGPFFVLFFSLGTLCAGALVNHPARMRIMAVCVLVWSVAMALFAFAETFEQLAACRLLVGLGQALFAPCALALIAEHAPDVRRGRFISAFTAGSSVGRSLAFVLSGAVLAALSMAALGSSNGRWRLVFLVMTAPNFLLFLGLWFARQPPSRTGRTGGTLIAAAAWLARRPLAALAVLGGAAAGVMAIQTVSAWGASVLNRQFDLPTATAALIFGTVLIPAALAGHLGGGWITDRVRAAGWTPGDVLCVALALAAGLCVAVSVASTAWAAALALGLAALCASTAALSGLLAMQAMTPPNLRGPMGAIFLATTSLIGFGVGPLTAGVISDHGHGAASLSGALSIVVAAAAVLGLAATLVGRPAWRLASAEADRS